MRPWGLSLLHFVAAIFFILRIKLQDASWQARVKLFKFIKINSITRWLALCLSEDVAQSTPEVEMLSIATINWRQWIKTADHPCAMTLRRLYRLQQRLQCPVVPGLHRLMLVMHRSGSQICHSVLQFVYFTPLFKSQLNNAPKVLHLYSGMPQLGGRLELSIGEDCRISGRSSLFGRTSGREIPELRIGCNVDIGWQNTIAVGRKVVLGDNVRLAGNVFLAGFPGHPYDAAARARGEAETDDQVGDIVLEPNVWLASGVTVLAGVTIGENSIIGAGSVVTRDIPANVIAAGNPARVIRSLTGGQP